MLYQNPTDRTVAFQLQHSRVCVELVGLLSYCNRTKAREKSRKRFFKLHLGKTLVVVVVTEKHEKGHHDAFQILQFIPKTVRV